jgi:signal transduction histidine kinase
MRQLPPRARLFVLGTIALGAVVSAAIPFLPGGPPRFDLTFVFYLAAALIAQLVGVRVVMPGREGQAWSLISAVLVPAIILFPPATNVLIVLTVFAAYAVKRRALPWYQNAWNIAQHELGVLVAALVWDAVRPGGTGGAQALHWYAAAFAAGMTFYLLNTLQTSAVLALVTRRSIREVEVFTRSTFYRELVLIWMGVIFADFWLDNPWRTVLLIVPLVGLSQMLSAQVKDAERIRRAQVEAEGRAQSLASLNELARDLTAGLDFDQVFDALYTQLAKAVNPGVLSIALYDPATTQLEFHVKKAGEGLLPVVYRRAEGPEVRGLLATRTPLILDPVRNRDTVQAVSPHGRLLECPVVTVIPMTLADRMVGLLLLGVAEPPAPPTLDLISTMASQVAVAADKVELFQRERRKTAQLSAITQVSKKIVTIHNVDVLLQQTSRLIEESFGFDRVAVVLQQDGTAPATDEGASAEIPIFFREQTIGRMAVWLRPGTALTADDLAMLQTLADEIAVAIENARLYEHLQQQMRMLEQTQLQLLQSAKLATIGELAAFIAHEINNPLTSVLGYASLLLSETNGDDPRRADIEVIEKEALRARAIVRDLLGYARQTDSAMAFTQVNEAIESVLPLVRQRAAGANVTIEARFDPALPSIMADVNQLKQVFINILNNAIDAMPDGGRVEVATRVVHGNGTNGGAPLVEISFQDSGVGIDPQHLEKIFDAFFTTKGAGRGTGLGLPISKRIVERHGGTITVTSEPGRGSCFTIQLPAAP